MDNLLLLTRQTSGFKISSNTFLRVLQKLADDKVNCFNCALHVHNLFSFCNIKPKKLFPTFLELCCKSFLMKTNQNLSLAVNSHNNLNKLYNLNKELFTLNLLKIEWLFWIRQMFQTLSDDLSIKRHIAKEESSLQHSNNFCGLKQNLLSIDKDMNQQINQNVMIR